MSNESSQRKAKNFHEDSNNIAELVYLLRCIHAKLRCVCWCQAAQSQVGRQRFVWVGAREPRLASQRRQCHLGFWYEETVVRFTLEVSAKGKFVSIRSRREVFLKLIPVPTNSSVVLSVSLFELNSAPDTRGKVRLADVSEHSSAAASRWLDNDSIVDLQIRRCF